MKTLRLTIATALAVAVVMLLMFQYREQIRLRKSEELLQAQVQKLISENQSLQAQKVSDEAARSLSGKEVSELLRLRGEVGSLRRQLHESEDRRGEGKQPAAQAAATTVTPLTAFGSDLHDMGATTPERAASSLIWAAATGDQKRIADLLALPQGVSEQDASKHYEFFAKQLSNVFAGMEFTSIESVGPNPDWTLRLNQMYRDIATGETHPFPFMMRLYDSGWKVVVEGDIPK
jgi:hypothetical protein